MLFRSPCSGQSNCGRKRLLGDCIDECEDRLRLVEGLCELDEVPDGFCVEQRFFQTGELGLLFRLPGFVFQGFDVLSTRYRQNVKFVIEDEAIIARTQGEYKPFIEPRDNLVVSGSPVSCMNVLKGQSVC